MVRPDEDTWLSVYLYYAEPWEEFLKEAVKPLVDKMISTGRAKHFFFVRYLDQSPHIRLRLKVTAQQKEKTEAEIREYFSSWFTRFPSAKTVLPIQSI